MLVANNFRHCPVSSKSNRTLLFSPVEREVIAAQGTRGFLVGILTFVTFVTFCWMVRLEPLQENGLGSGRWSCSSDFCCFGFPLHLANGPVVHVSSVWYLSLRCLLDCYSRDATA